MRSVICIVACFVGVYALAGQSYLGVQLAPVDEGVAQYLGIEGGAFVAAVDAGSPAAAAGLQPRDIVTSWDGTAVTGADQLAELVKAAAADKPVAVRALRRGKVVELTVSLKQEEDTSAEKPGPGYLGIAFGPVPPLLQDYLQLGENPGVMVQQVLEATPAAKAGLKPKDIITKINDEPVGAPEAFGKLMAGLHAGDTIRVEGIRSGAPLKAEAALSERPGPLRALPEVPPSDTGAMPHLEQHKGKIILRFRGPDGKEYEQVLELPSHGFPPNFEFPIPQYGNFRQWFKDNDAFKNMQKSMEDVKKRMEKFSEEMEQRHKNLLRKSKKSGELRVEAMKPGTGSGSVVVQTNRAFIRSDDGTYDISIRSEGDKKTVSVKKGGEVVAEDLPFEKIDTLPADVQEKVKELEKSVKVEVDAEAEAEGLSVPQKDVAPKEGAKRPHRLPTEQL